MNMTRREFVFCCSAALISAMSGASGAILPQKSRAGAFARRKRSYSVPVLGDIHFDSPDSSSYHSDYTHSTSRQRYEAHLAEHVRNAEMWKERLPRLIRASGTCLASDAAFALQVGDLVQGDCGNAATHKRMLDFVKRHDPARLVDGPSGWCDFEGGQVKTYGQKRRTKTDHLPANECEAADVVDYHYYRGPAMPPANDRRVSFLGEFGGLGHPVEGHLWHECDQGIAANVGRGSWGYGGIEDTRTREGLEQTYLGLMEKLGDIAEAGLAGSIYTQTTDVEIEINGLLTYDRKVLKYNPAALKAAHEAIIHRASESAKENREGITP